MRRRLGVDTNAVKRAFSILLAAIAAVLVVAPAAQSRELNLTPSVHAAVSDHYIYWVKVRPASCTGCNQLWRTSIEDGSAAPVLGARKGLINDLTASGQTIAFTQSRRVGRNFLTSVRMLSETGVQRTVATGVFRRNARSNCGELVGAGSISAVGELAWQKITLPKTNSDCASVDRQVRWRAIGSGLTTPDRLLWSPQMQSGELLSYDEVLSSARPITGFDGVRLLVSPDSSGPALLNISTGTRTDFKPDAISDYSSGGVLTSAGGVAAFRYRDADDGWDPILFPDVAAAKTPLELSVPGTETMSLRICGSDLVQLAQETAGIVLVRRDPTGNVKATSRVAMPMPLSFSWFECNASTAVVFHRRMTKQQRVIEEGAFSTPIP